MRCELCGTYTPLRKTYCAVWATEDWQPDPGQEWATKIKFAACRRCFERVVANDLFRTMSRNESPESVRHPTYGTIDDLLAEIKDDVEHGYDLRMGLHGALLWFSGEYSRLRREVPDG